MKTKRRLQTKVVFYLFPPFGISPRSPPPNSPFLSFPFLHSSHFCLISLSSSSPCLLISALPFSLYFPYNPSGVSSSWPLFPALSWFTAELLCCYFQELVKKAHILNTQECKCFCLCLPACIKHCDLLRSETLSAVWPYVEGETAACEQGTSRRFFFPVVSVKRSSCCAVLTALRLSVWEFSLIIVVRRWK